MLGANVLPHADIHEHHSLNINATEENRMRCECVTLTALWNDAALMQLRHLKGEQVLLLPRLCVHERSELLRRRSDWRMCALNDGKLVRPAVWPSEKPIAKLRHEN